jgi:hypothetical protein
MSFGPKQNAPKQNAPRQIASEQDAPHEIAPAQNDDPAPSHCSLCGHYTDLVELPGLPDKYCSACSADVATSILLKTEINAAWLSGLRYDPLAAELAQLSQRLLERAQSA